ncbi:MAG: CaiB/BaiF CoA-transferase family protein [Kibdelosporangium sp.]
MRTGPLAGVRVVELAGIGPAPFCAMLLADLGADVIRVDRPGGVPAAGAPSRDLLNRGKRSVLVDLKNDRGAEVVLRLAEQADVLIEGYRPGVAERLGIGPQQCWERNPKLVYGRMTGWGQDGPLAQTAGHDIAYIAITGVLHAIGRADGPPQVPLNLVGDFGGGSLYLAVGILAALRHAEQTGQGQVVDAAIVDGSAHLATLIYGLVSAGVWQPERGVNLLDTGAPFYDVYETSDGGHMAVGPLESQFYQEFVRLLGVDGADLPAQFDFPRWPELRKRFAEVFATRTRREWTDVFDGTDACVAPILSLAEAHDHPHIAARGTLVERDGLVQPAPAPRFSATKAELSTPPALPGQHTRPALADWGFQDVDELLAHGAVQDRDDQ